MPWREHPQRSRSSCSTPSPASLRSLARAAISRALRQWPAARRFEEDLEQEAVVAALEALRTWDSSRASWSTWAWWSIKTAVRRFLLANLGPVAQPHSRDRSSAPRSLGAALPASLRSNGPDPEVRALAIQAVALLEQRARSALQPAHRRSPLGLSFDVFIEREVEVFVRHAIGEPVADVAALVRLSRQGVYDSLRRLRRALR